MQEYLTKHNVINCHQHGFREGKSCFTNLLETFENLNKAVDEKKGVDVIYLDFKKAFDSVPHQRLLCKLQGYEISGKLLNWIRNF